MRNAEKSPTGNRMLRLLFGPKIRIAANQKRFIGSNDGNLPSGRTFFGKRRAPIVSG